MNKRTKNILLWVLDVGINIGIIVGLVLVIQRFLIAPFDISGGSMCDTFNYIDDQCENGFGEKIIANAATYLFDDPERGDVVVFSSPNEEDNGKFFIKRVIGLGGDTVEIKSGEVYVKKAGTEEFVVLEEPYLNEKNAGDTRPFFSDFTVFEVPEGKYMLLGDNRRASTDSRSCFKQGISVECKKHPEDSFIDRSLIRGEAWFVWWPFDSMRKVEKVSYSVDQQENIQE